ncbi:hypothetical protein D0Z70_15735 [Sphingobium terrigena]|uniref:Uncharacterized protein n=1 Tax=Sphingobium terrigena TaxID=2304063 RepID=A0A418YPW2_9SPHN|nr:hypothetical protein [Sphingobium terrigena]RJG53469.1 hypothetical protein D0Z70_15735 [Sphingobium terrigena]
MRNRSSRACRPGLDTVNALARFIAEHGGLGAALLDHCDDDLEEGREALEDRYLGTMPALMIMCRR